MPPPLVSVVARLPIAAQARVRSPDWAWVLRVAAIALVAAMNLMLVARVVIYLLGPAWGHANDWDELVLATQSSNPYLVADGYRWSPVAAWILAAVLPLGIGFWRALHFVSLLWLRDWRLIGLTVLSWPFWSDMVAGNVVTFAAVAAWCALRGSRLAIVVFLTLAVTMPRPLFLPVVAWLLWRQAWARRAFAVVFMLHLALVIASGLGVEWIGRLVASGSELGHFQNLAPSHWVGLVWIPVGLALAALFTIGGRLGIASLLASAYVFPYYAMFLILEAAGPGQTGARAGPATPRA